MNNLISIIVPVYNVAPYLDRCIQSIVAQTHQDIEILLIDDGSTDDSGAICDKYAKQDNRIVVVHKQNGGVSSARNLGMDIAKGEYIGFIDSDDYIEPNMYERLHGSIIRENADLAVCGFKQVRVNGDTRVNDATSDMDWSKENIIKNYFTQGIIKELMYAPVNKLYKKSMLDDLRYCTQYRMGEDILFLFKVIDKMNKMVYVEGSYYHYIMRENSAMTSKFSAKRLEYVYAIRDIETICVDKYPYAIDSAKIWVYRHVLNTLRQLIVSNMLDSHKDFYTENKTYLKQNKKYHFGKLSLNQKIDYILIMYCHWLLKLKVKLS
ncbi:MAG: glycosyltransferase family 2 protein [Clostridia bacterium]|nr:glycosyltransferase family 2 protein [Clostridia bacterium]